MLTNRLFHVLTALFLVFIILPATAQTFDLQFVEVQNDGVNGGVYAVRAEIRAQSGSFNAGNGNFVMEYNSAALDTGHVSAEALIPLSLSGFISGSPFIAYQIMTITKPFGNTVSLNVELASDPPLGQGLNIDTNWLAFAIITFTITDETSTSGITWRTVTPSATNMFLDDPFTQAVILGNLNGIDNALPVELSAFQATTAENGVQLNWTTQSEVNNLGFEVYRSTAVDGEFQQLSSYETNTALEGAGNSSNAINYSYLDATVAAGATYWYQIADVDLQGIRTFHGPIEVQAADNLPTEYALRANYPNPFNPSTKIQYEIPQNQLNSRVKLVVYNTLGMQVKTLVSGNVAPGIHIAEWDGTNNSGASMASGIYFVNLQAGQFSQTRKMVLLR